MIYWIEIYQVDSVLWLSSNQGLIVKKILLVSTLGYVKRTVWRICMLMLESRGLITWLSANNLPVCISNQLTDIQWTNKHRLSNWWLLLQINLVTKYFATLATVTKNSCNLQCCAFFRTIFTNLYKDFTST